MYTLEILNGTNWEYLFHTDNLERISITIKALINDSIVYHIRVLENDKVLSHLTNTKAQYEWFRSYFIEDNSIYKKLEKRK